MPCSLAAVSALGSTDAWPLERRYLLLFCLRLSRSSAIAMSHLSGVITTARYLSRFFSRLDVRGEFYPTPAEGFHITADKFSQASTGYLTCAFVCARHVDGQADENGTLRVCRTI